MTDDRRPSYLGQSRFDQEPMPLTSAQAGIAHTVHVGAAAQGRPHSRAPVSRDLPVAVAVGSRRRTQDQVRLSEAARRAGLGVRIRFIKHVAHGDWSGRPHARWAGECARSNGNPQPFCSRHCTRRNRLAPDGSGAKGEERVQCMLGPARRRTGGSQGCVMDKTSSAASSCSSVSLPSATYPRSSTTSRIVFRSAKDCLATFAASSYPM